VKEKKEKCSAGKSRERKAITRALMVGRKGVHCIGGEKKKRTHSFRRGPLRELRLGRGKRSKTKRKRIQEEAQEESLEEGTNTTIEAPEGEGKNRICFIEGGEEKERICKEWVQKNKSKKGTGKKREGETRRV